MSNIIELELGKLTTIPHRENQALYCPLCRQQHEDINYSNPAHEIKLPDWDKPMWVCNTCYHNDVFECECCRKHLRTWKMDDEVFDANGHKVCMQCAHHARVYKPEEYKRLKGLKEKSDMPERPSNNKLSDQTHPRYHPAHLEHQPTHLGYQTEPVAGFADIRHDSFTCPCCLEIRLRAEANVDAARLHGVIMCDHCYGKPDKRYSRTITKVCDRFEKEEKSEKQASKTEKERLNEVHDQIFGTNLDDSDQYEEDRPGADYLVRPDRRKKQTGALEFWCHACNCYHDFSELNVDYTDWVLVSESGVPKSRLARACKQFSKNIQSVDSTLKQITPASAPKSKEEVKMNFNKLFGGQIGPDNSGLFKMSMLGMAIRQEDGSYAAYNGNEMVDVMDMVMPGMDGGIFRLPVTDVEVDDLIVQGKEVFYVRSLREDGGIEALNPKSNKIEVLMPAGNLFGFKFFTKVVSLFDGFFGGIDTENPGSNIGQMIMMSALFGDGNSNPFGGLIGNTSSSGKDGGMGQMMQLMMMSQLFGGKTGANPFEALFSGFATPAKKTPAPRKSRSKAAAAAAEAAEKALAADAAAE